MKILLRWSACILFCLLVTTAWSQQSGFVFERGSGRAIQGVSVINTQLSDTTFTDQLGAFYWKVGDELVFEKTGFKTVVLGINDEFTGLVELNASPNALAQVVIRSGNRGETLDKMAQSVTVLEPKQIQINNIANIAPVLNTVPGVYMHNGTLTTNRITIRGIGSRNLFGTSKIRAFYQDIPLTNGSGSSTIEDLELESLGRMEVLKGPTSSLYGSGLGGSIRLLPFKGSFANNEVRSSFAVGSFGYQKGLVQADISGGKQTATITYSRLQSDGYRENNETDRHAVSWASRHILGKHDRLTFVGNFTDLKAFIPSSLSEEDFLDNPEQAAFTWGQAMGFEEYQKGLFGLSWSHVYSDDLQQYTSVFTSFRNNYEPRPFNILDESEWGWGIRSRLTGQGILVGKKIRWSLGGEWFFDQNDFSTFANLYRDFPPGTGSVQGGRLDNLKEKRSYFNVFLDSGWDLNERTQINLGLNLNQTQYRLEDRLINNGVDNSGKYTYDLILSPKLGATYQLKPNVTLYASIAHGFSPPNLEETLLPDGNLNPDIQPERGWNFEIGSRGAVNDGRISWEAAVFYMPVKDLLVARRTSEDEFIGVNAGRTNYLGLEGALNISWIEAEQFRLIHRNALAINHFRFDDFVDDGNDYSGNKLTGVPNWTFNSILEFDWDLGLYANINFVHVGDIPLRDDNSVFSDDYQLINLKAGYRKQLKRWRIELFGGINNLFDTNYASMVLINASSFGGNSPRYFYPGEPINYYSGLGIAYKF
ncbi:TonB-dependent receptor family protein [Aureitalea marina]|uniref:TonB-dependent receptor n=1 Tax=Aureitalea marina TaxID=930804 RepID=A0A2S7KNQ3_9FLAO|nr:TonB-dependent receptor [Aureitalea marina]PQB04252.1 hypothetical protein BST85_04540 [Aureitalea marina]